MTYNSTESYSPEAVLIESLATEEANLITSAKNIFKISIKRYIPPESFSQEAFEEGINKCNEFIEKAFQHFIGKIADKYPSFRSIPEENLICGSIFTNKELETLLENSIKDTLKPHFKTKDTKELAYSFFTTLEGNRSVTDNIQKIGKNKQDLIKKFIDLKVDNLLGLKNESELSIAKQEIINLLKSSKSSIIIFSNLELSIKNAKAYFDNPKETPSGYVSITAKAKAKPVDTSPDISV